MTDAKPFASLSSGLLARKGAAKPAMRRPSPSFHSGIMEQDDLGWNDMGYDVDPDPNADQDSARAFRQNPLMGAIPESDPGQRARIEEVAERLNGHALPSEEQLEQAAADAEFSAEPVEANGYALHHEPDDANDALHAKPGSYEGSSEPDTPEAAWLRAAWPPIAAPDSDMDAKDAPDIESTEAEALDVESRDIDAPAYAPSEIDVAEEPSRPLLAVKPQATQKLLPSITPPATKAATPASKAAKPVGKAAKSKSAFTLRLDQDRHLKLRLACAVRNVSAQKLVTAAVDELLASMPELDELTRHVPPRLS